MSGVGLLSRLAAAVRGLLILWLAVCPMLSATPSSPAAVPFPPSAPAGENEEEENSCEVRSAVEWVAPRRADRRAVEPAPSYLALLPLPSRPVPSPTRPTRPTAADPFANGLGSPYRC